MCRARYCTSSRQEAFHQEQSFSIYSQDAASLDQQAVCMQAPGCWRPVVGRTAANSMSLEDCGGNVQGDGLWLHGTVVALRDATRCQWSCELVDANALV